jgi:DNA-binding GntR family transcriptional regulator
MALYKFTDTTEVSNAPISTSLLAKMQRDILTGEMKPGHKIVEQELCRKYGVSRTPIREALRQLEADGLVENILNRGAFVIGMSDQDYEDMFELRKAYEVQAVKWAIERINEEEMERLEETFEFMEFYTMRNDIDKMLVINTEFHHVIYEAYILNVFNAPCLNLLMLVVSATLSKYTSLYNTFIVTFADDILFTLSNTKTSIGPVLTPTGHIK